MKYHPLIYQLSQILQGVIRARRIIPYYGKPTNYMIIAAAFCGGERDNSRAPTVGFSSHLRGTVNNTIILTKVRLFLGALQGALSRNIRAWRLARRPVRIIVL